MNCPLLNSAHSKTMMMMSALEGVLIHGLLLCISFIGSRYSSFSSFNKSIIIIMMGSTSAGMPSPLNSGPWSVIILPMIVIPSVIVFALKNIHANVVNTYVIRTLRNKGVVAFFFLSLKYMELNTKYIPCKPPQQINVQFAPCQSPLVNIVSIRFL